MNIELKAKVNGTSTNYPKVIAYPNQILMQPKIYKEKMFH